ncbi:class I adenylate-forming enzyme family protein [Verrucosispora sp. NA02020]|uniref:class I adenylate-forming enzyme family protein n=2 Tax=unclassified Micromonospora TaxID=2617518 RepID=UPI0010D6570D|nr:AMP-binding protein [Verrucosispora sp. NA02020]QKW13797.1 AMP-binding protein [Verrucosispora sp. NA02020]TBL40251.1 fatty acid--CoA ligase [Verrucosispora sp. SN26_14.1]
MRSLASVGPGDWPTMSAHAYPDAPALRTPDGVALTFAGLEARASRLASALRAAGIAPGERIAILGTDSVGYAVTLFASLKLGTIGAPLNYRLAAAELSALTALADPAVLVLESRYAHLLDDLRAAAPGLRLVLTLDGPSAGIASIEEFGDAHDPPGPASLPAATSDDDVLLWMLTSGTTGTPRVVAQTQRMLKANTAKGVLEQGFQPGECLYAGTPLFHVSGMGWLYYAISRGAALMLLPQFDAAAVLGCLRSGVVTRCLLVPSMVVALLDHPDAGAVPALRSIAYGGSAMPPELVRRLHETFGCDLYNTFGAGTEGGGQTILRPADHRAAFAGQPHLLGSIGRPMFGVDLRLCDADGNEVGVGTVGEIRTRSDTVMSGYVGNPELTATKVVDGWIRSGDMAWRDDEGYLYLAGRVDDMILRGGENVFPAEIENVLVDHPTVAEAAVVGLPDQRWGQIVVAAVVAGPGAVPDPDELRAHCRSRLAGYKTPARVVVVAALPKNASGKTVRAALAADLAVTT